MKDSFSPQWKILPPAQKRLWPMLKPAAEHGFVLYGGTAIALRLGHRTSVDFDFFSDQPLDKDALKRDLPFLRKGQVLQNRENTLTVSVSAGREKRDAVKLSFFGDIRFGRVGRPQWTEDGILQAASLDDLMGTKLAVLQQRVASRDYQDIAAMIKAGYSLARGLAVSRVLYGASFQPNESLKALVYFEGGDLASLSAENRRGLVEAVHSVDPLPLVRRVSKKLGLK